MVKNLPVNAGDSGDAGSISESGRSPGVGNRNPLQYSCLDNLMDRGAWWATISARVIHTVKGFGIVNKAEIDVSQPQVNHI